VNNFILNETGTTIIEAMIAMLIAAIVMLGGLNFFYGGEYFINRIKNKRTALVIVENRMELAHNFPYSVLADSLNENNTQVSMGDILGLRTTTVNSIDDGIDSLGASDLDSNDYKKMTVSFQWTGKSTQTITLSSYISKYW
jgi:Tfp pilus assembly protein PilV